MFVGWKGNREAYSYISIALGLHAKVSVVDIRGRNSDVDGSPEDVWEGGGLYTGQPSAGVAETIEVFSSDAADTSAGTGARTIRVFGLDENWELQQEDFTLNGTTPVASATLWQRVYLAYVLTGGSGGANAGIITARHTSTTANVFFGMPIGYNESELAAYTIPHGYVGHIVRMFAIIFRESGGTVDREVDLSLRVREPGGVYRAEVDTMVYTQSGVEEIEILGGIDVPPCTDIVLRVDGTSNNNTTVVGGFDVILRKL